MVKKIAKSIQKRALLQFREKAVDLLEREGHGHLRIIKVTAPQSTFLGVKSELRKGRRRKVGTRVEEIRSEQER